VPGARPIALSFLIEPISSISQESTVLRLTSICLADRPPRHLALGGHRPERGASRERIKMKLGRRPHFVGRGRERALWLLLAAVLFAVLWAIAQQLKWPVWTQVVLAGLAAAASLIIQELRAWFGQADTRAQLVEQRVKVSDGHGRLLRVWNVGLIVFSFQPLRCWEACPLTRWGSHTRIPREEKQPPCPWPISISSGLPRARERWGCISCPIPRPPNGTDQRHMRLVIDDVEVYQRRLTGAGEKIPSA
jgi:hypothetical protein